MLLRGSVLIVFALATVFSNRAYPDQVDKAHEHKTPHGGIVQEAEGMHVEFLMDKSGQPKLYLYDKSMKPLERTDLQAKLTLKGHNGSQQSRELKASKNPKEGIVFVGEPIKEMKDWDTAVVSLKMKERWTHLRFSHHRGEKAGH